eukprot:4647733-Prymnesium_polylepis.1
MSCEPSDRLHASQKACTRPLCPAAAGAPARLEPCKGGGVRGALDELLDHVLVRRVAPLTVKLEREVCLVEDDLALLLPRRCRARLAPAVPPLPLHPALRHPAHRPERVCRPRTHTPSTRNTHTLGVYRRHESLSLARIKARAVSCCAALRRAHSL